MSNSTAIPKEIPKEISCSRITWGLWGIGLHILRFGLAIVGGVSAAVITVKGAEKLTSEEIRTLSTIAVICSGVTVANLGAKANAYGQAKEHITTAILRFRCVEDSKIDNLIDSYSQAQQMIASVSIFPFVKAKG